MIGGEFGGNGSMEKIERTPESLLELMARPGWEGLDQIDQLMAKARSAAGQFSEADARNEAYLACFSGGAGATVLNDLIENVLLMPSAGLQPGKSIAEHAAFAIASDAQKMLVWGILTKMHLARERLNTTSSSTQKPEGNEDAQPA